MTKATRPPKTKAPKQQAATPHEQALAAILASGAPLIERVANDGPHHTVNLTDAGRAALRCLAAEGNDQATIAHRLGIGRKTLQDILQRDELANEASQVGKSALSSELAHLLLQNARAGNVVAAIYLSKARCGWRENDTPETKPAITIVLPGAMNEQQYLESIKTIEHKPSGDNNGT
jgi:hypothetical protein